MRDTSNLKFDYNDMRIITNYNLNNIEENKILTFLEALTLILGASSLMFLIIHPIGNWLEFWKYSSIAMSTFFIVMVMTLLVVYILSSNSFTESIDKQKLSLFMLELKLDMEKSMQGSTVEKKDELDKFKLITIPSSEYFVPSEEKADALGYDGKIKYDMGNYWINKNRDYIEKKKQEFRKKREESYSKLINKIDVSNLLWGEIPNTLKYNDRWDKINYIDRLKQLIEHIWINGDINTGQFQIIDLMISRRYKQNDKEWFMKVDNYLRTNGVVSGYMDYYEEIYNELKKEYVVEEEFIQRYRGETYDTKY